VTSWDDYYYPGTDVLRNKLGIQDKEELERTERRLVEQRLAEGCPEGNFDLAHLQAIHLHLFQDVYEWAGQLRTVDMYKSAPGEFQPSERIEMAVRGAHELAVRADFLRNMNVWEFSDKAAQIIGDINQAHPFREGNGRTQFEFLEQLGERAGHNVDTTKIERAAWMEASIEASQGNYGAMNDQIRAAIVPTLEKSPLVEKQTWEQAVKDDDALRVRELQDQRDAQQEALEAILKGVTKRGNDPIEREQKLRDFEEKCKQQLTDKLREQQERLERLELLYKGPPAGRERG
jgi:cell filamentation protein